jgi:hypothetical protein
MQLAVAREDTNELANARCPRSAFGSLAPPSPPRPHSPPHPHTEGVRGGGGLRRLGRRSRASDVGRAVCMRDDERGYLMVRYIFKEGGILI